MKKCCRLWTRPAIATSNLQAYSPITCETPKPIAYEHLRVTKATCVLSCSAVSDFLLAHALYPASSSVHDISQARILEWVANSSSRGSSQPRNWTQVSLFAGRFFTSWATEPSSNILFLLVLSFASMLKAASCSTWWMPKAGLAVAIS